MILPDILISFYIFFEIGEKPIEKKLKYIILKNNSMYLYTQN